MDLGYVGCHLRFHRTLGDSLAPGAVGIDRHRVFLEGVIQSGKAGILILANVVTNPAQEIMVLFLPHLFYMMTRALNPAL